MATLDFLCSCGHPKCLTDRIRLHPEQDGSLRLTMQKGNNDEMHFENIYLQPNQIEILKQALEEAYPTPAKEVVVRKPIGALIRERLFGEES